MSIKVSPKACSLAVIKPSQLLSAEERLALTRPSDLVGFGLVLKNWGLIFLLLGLAAHYPGAVTALLVLVLLPGRQLGLAVLMHEAGHGSLFATPALNGFVGQWLCALPTLGDLPSYAAGHLEHHRKVGTDEDPDLVNYAAYPISTKSFGRKIFRDLTGQTGAKLLVSLFKGGAGNMNRAQVQGRALLLKQVLVQVALFLSLYALDWGWTWLLWFVTFMTTYMLVIRVRQIAEHGAVPDLYSLDPRGNTRTVEASYWQRFLVAPHGVNFHLEHHFMAAVPCYRLPHLRRLLRARGYFDNTPVFLGYGAVFKKVLQRTSSVTS
ncbi:MAG: fatty acid desaturase family protein [Luminiphilus sp.]|nr:fatty acid desaturase family protein [Luminiphilus sp.]